MLNIAEHQNTNSCVHVIIKVAIIVFKIITVNTYVVCHMKMCVKVGHRCCTYFFSISLNLYSIWLLIYLPLKFYKVVSHP